MIEGSTKNDYIYKAGVQSYDFDKALEQTSKAMRDASKAKLQDLLYQFNANPILKSIIRDGENSSIFEDVDPETAQKYTNAFRALKELAEAALEYETDFGGNNFVKFLRKIVNNADGFYGQLSTNGGGLIVDANATYFENEKLNAISIKARSVAAKHQNAAEKVSDFLNLFTVGVEGARAILSYVEYSETADYYERRKLGIESNMTDENLEESLRLLESIDIARGQEGAKVVSNLFGFGAAGAKIWALGKISKPFNDRAAYMSQFVPGGKILAVTYTSAFGVGTGAAADTGTKWVQSVYESGEHPYAGRIPTWNEITGKKIGPSPNLLNYEIPESSLNLLNSAIPESSLNLLNSAIPVSSANLLNSENNTALTTLKGNGGDDGLSNDDDRVFMSGGSGDDAVVNYGSYVTM